MSFQNKYLKYKNKYLDLKNQIGGSTYVSPHETCINDNEYVICLLWINKDCGSIHQSSLSGEDLHIRDNIVKTYHMFKNYRNKNVIIFLNFNKINLEDYTFFEQNKINTKDLMDINKFEIINETKYLRDLFISNKSYQLPIYLCVDILKILIQYELLKYHSYKYVIFADLDIKDITNTDTTNITCSKDDVIKEYNKNNIFTREIIELLDIFGYLMATTTKDKDGVLFNSKPENGFLIAQNKPTVIKAIKNYFINYLFLNLINDYQNNTTKYTNNYIYHSYGSFYIYLNFLNEIINLQYYLENYLENYEQFQQYEPFFKEPFKLEEDYKIIDHSCNIDILTERCLDYFIKNYGYPNSNNDFLFYKTGKKYDIKLTDKGLEIITKYKDFIYPVDIKNQIIPSICVFLDNQKNSKVS